MAKSIKFKKSRGEQIGEALGTAAMLYGGYKLGEQKGLWGGEQPSAPTGMSDAPRGVIPDGGLDRSPAGIPAADAPAQPGPTRVAAAQRARAASAAPVPPTPAATVSVPPRSVSAADSDARLLNRALNVGALQDTASVPAFLAGATVPGVAAVPAPVLRPQRSIINPSVTPGFKDGGSVGSCEPSRSARSFPKKGK